LNSSTAELVQLEVTPKLLEQAQLVTLMKIVYTLAAIALLSFSTPAMAQPKPDEQYVLQIENRATMVINSTMEQVGARAEDFNKQISHIFALMPLEAIHLDTSMIQKNIVTIDNFLQYLEDYRLGGKSLSKTLTDSITAIRAELPTKNRKRFLVSFEKAYTKDVSAFDGYIVTLSKLFKRVNETLTFLTTTEFQISKSKSIEFKNEADHNRFKELMTAVESANKELSKATESSKKATAEANTVMQDVYGKRSR
jgi:hypothetical protein